MCSRSYISECVYLFFLTVIITYEHVIINYNVTRRYQYSPGQVPPTIFVRAPEFFWTDTTVDVKKNEIKKITVLFNIII